MCKVNRCICFTRYLSRGVNLTDRCAFLADSYVLSSFPKSVLRIISQELSFIKLFMSQSLFVSVSLDAEGNVCKWELVSAWSGVEKNLKEENINSVILTIEGAHVFNSGLNIYGKETDEKEVFRNVKKIATEKDSRTI